MSEKQRLAVPNRYIGESTSMNKWRYESFRQDTATVLRISWESVKNYEAQMKILHSYRKKGPNFSYDTLLIVKES